MPEMNDEERSKIVVRLMSGHFGLRQVDAELVADWVSADRQKILAPLVDTYKKYEHLDKLLSDKEWLVDSDSEHALMNGMLYDMWKSTIATLRLAGLTGKERQCFHHSHQIKSISIQSAEGRLCRK